MADYKETKQKVIATSDEWNKLVCYLLMSTQHRNGELEAWKSLAEEKDENGNLKFPNAPSNAKYWEDLNNFLEDFRKKIDNAEYVDAKEEGGNAQVTAKEVVKIIANDLKKVADKINL